ncbi:MAG: nucleoside phosphorylase [Candidatus Gottesmanbacteria bacterium]|nr:nucleoside phosphorylase [Candidatus Gottesmanbacteria bacterium]
MDNKKISAKAPTTTTGKQYHIDCASGDVAPFVLVPGDPARVGKIASLWDTSHEVAHHREYHTMTGAYQGIPISCTSSGIGGPSLAIAVDELCRIGAHTFIRVGSTGGIQKGQEIGDLVISTGAVRLEGTSRDFVIPEYPAIASYELVMALIQAAEELHMRYHVGITASTDTFYTGQGRPAYNHYFPSHKDHIFRDMQTAGVQNFEMEAATLFTMTSLFNKRAGAVCCIVANRVTDEFRIDDEMQKRAGLVASRAAVLLTTWDLVKHKTKKRHLYPTLLIK